MPSTLTEDDYTRDLLTAGVDLNSCLLAKVKENLRKTFGKLDLTNVLFNAATWCIFARDCLWESFLTSRAVGTCIRGLFLLENAGQTEYPDWKFS